MRARGRLGRICKVCGARFVPNGKYSHICEKCFKKSRDRVKKMKGGKKK